MGIRPVDQTDYKGLAVNWHHELVIKWQEALKAAGLNIHSPDYGHVLEVPDHIKLHRRGYVIAQMLCHLLGCGKNTNWLTQGFWPPAPAWQAGVPPTP